MAVDFAQLRATTLNRPSVVSSLVSLGRAILGLQTGKAGVTQTRLVSVPLLAAGPMNGYILDTQAVAAAVSGLTGAIDAVPPTVTDVTFGGTTIAATSTSRANPTPIAVDGVITAFYGGALIQPGLSAATTPTMRIRFASSAALNDVNLSCSATGHPLGSPSYAAGSFVGVKTMGAANEAVEVSYTLTGLSSGDSVAAGVLFPRADAADTNTGTVVVLSITLEYSVTETLAV